MEFTGHLPAHYPHRTLDGGGAVAVAAAAVVDIVALVCWCSVALLTLAKTELLYPKNAGA